MLGNTRKLYKPFCCLLGLVVSHDVSEQISPLNETFGTNGASVRFLLQVEFLVIPEVLRSGKLGIAPKNIADVRPLAGVFPDRELSKTRKKKEEF